MFTKHIMGALIVALVPIQLLSFAPPATIPRLPAPALSTTQSAWMHELELCESNGNPLAINPEDTDGTPSYGLFEFKPSTLTYFEKRYGLATTTIMDPIGQQAVVEQMIVREDVKWSQQFPMCTRKLGKPPL